MAGTIPRTATLALPEATLPWIVELASDELREVARMWFPLTDAIRLYEGHLVNPVVARAHGLPWTPLAHVCGAPTGARVDAQLEENPA